MFHYTIKLLGRHKRVVPRDSHNDFGVEKLCSQAQTP